MRVTRPTSCVFVVAVLVCAVTSVDTASEDEAAVPVQLLQEGQSRYLDAALDAARWIESTAIVDDDGRRWPAVPGERESVVRSLYTGTPGVVLFLLNLHRVTGEPGFLRRAEEGADWLIETLPAAEEEASSGLYTGLAGTCFTLLEVSRASTEARFAEASGGCYAQVASRATPAGGGVEWSDVTDVIGGGAGIGLALLDAGSRLARPELIELAASAGRRLLQLGQDAEGGAKWPMSPQYGRMMPNFSHGTAGIAYFLAALYEATSERVFLDGAVAGARYLRAVAETEGDVCLVFHHEPDGEDLFYLSWCHGPAGTGRTFYQLYRLTGEREWLRWTLMSAEAVLQSGIPERRTPGFWNNVGQCCGSAGVVEFFLDLHEITGQERFAAFARRVTDDLLERVTATEEGARWIQAEHRVQPDNLAAQTGYMQGAAGIGSALLRMHVLEHAGPRTIVLPDSPFGKAAPR